MLTSIPERKRQGERKTRTRFPVCPSGYLRRSCTNNNFPYSVLFTALQKSEALFHIRHRLPVRVVVLFDHDPLRAACNPGFQNLFYAKLAVA